MLAQTLRLIWVEGWHGSFSTKSFCSSMECHYALILIYFWGLHKPNKAVTTKEAFRLYSLDKFWYLANTLKYVSLNTAQMLQLTDL